jgi:hypothetical protein
MNEVRPSLGVRNASLAGKVDWWLPGEQAEPQRGCEIARARKAGCLVPRNSLAKLQRHEPTAMPVKRRDGSEGRRTERVRGLLCPFHSGIHQREIGK